MRFRRLIVGLIGIGAVIGCRGAPESIAPPPAETPRQTAVETARQKNVARARPEHSVASPSTGRPEAFRLHLGRSGGSREGDMGVLVSSTSGQMAVLVRSTTDLSLSGLNAVLYPISILTELSAACPYSDSYLADGAVYFYQLRQGERTSPVERLELPPRPLPTLKRPRLLVDKLHYVLDVLDGDRLRKRYPLALGRNPGARKLCFDNSSTPEGTYRIVGRQNEAQFYKAYDLDYPNALDRARYRAIAKQRKLPPIGGEIEIHGGDIQANWTFGCMALRNPDIDELFAHQEIGVGTPVTIVGSELTRAMVRAQSQSQPWLRQAQERLRAGGYHPGPCDGKLRPSTCSALGLFQQRGHLIVTMLPDAQTLAALKSAFPATGFPLPAR